VKIKYLGILVAILFTQVSLALPTQEKFKGFINRIEAGVQTYGGLESKLDEFAAGDIRQSLFSIQTLADLYSARYPSLQEVRLTTKRLEDAIGGYRKTLEQYDYAVQAGAGPEKLALLEANKAQGKASLAFFLEQNGWNNGTALNRLKEIVATAGWQSDVSDKVYTYSALSKQVKTIDDTPWDMTVLEGGGIHDLRKAVRWYKLEVSALTDIMGTQIQSCAQGPILPSQAQGGGKCLISDCLHAHMLTIYDVFGAIKDIGEGQEGMGGHVPQEKLDEAAALYKEIKDKDIFKNLSEELNACANDLLKK
jgi:hypothetical protein